MDSAAASTMRILQEESRGRTVLTILYLIVLGLCFIVPVFYYFRMHCEDRQARRLREMEMTGIEASLREQQHQSREETRAARRKYREEKRARLLQLFAPVQMTLTEDNFPHLRKPKDLSINSLLKSSPSVVVEGSFEKTPAAESLQHASSPMDALMPPAGTNGGDGGDALRRDPSKPEVDALLRDHDKADPMDLEKGTALSVEDESGVFDDEIFGETSVVEIPAAGLSLEQSKNQRRAVSNVCAICLSGYEVGDDIVWASNPVCDHAFHKECIERWLIKQRGSPMCPCCRRDFVLDPLDESDDAEGLLDHLEGLTTPSTPASPSRLNPQTIVATRQTTTESPSNNSTDNQPWAW